MKYLDQQKSVARIKRKISARSTSALLSKISCSVHCYLDREAKQKLNEDRHTDRDVQATHEYNKRANFYDFCQAYAFTYIIYRRFSAIVFYLPLHKF